MDNFFAQFNSQESLAILFFLLISFLFGLLIGYLLRSRRIAQLRKALDDSERATAEAQAQVLALKEQLDLLNADLKKAMFEAEEQIARAARLEEDNTRQYNEMFALNAEVERLQGINTAYGSNIEDLNHQILGLKMRTGELSAAVENAPAVALDQSGIDDSISRLEVLVDKLGRTEAENNSLKTALAEALAKLETAPAPAILSTLTFEAPEPEEPELIFQQDKSVLHETITMPGAETDQDDLTRIEGIGPFLAQKLNEAGVFTYQQISEWDASSIGQITEAIGYFQGRIERDNWVGQAAELARLKRENPEALQSKPSAMPERTDLKLIEGIGPKIEELLHQAGIMTWDDLAETPVEQLEQILEEAGGRFRIHTPGTWPAQARLAANGDWALLQEYQDQLKGGRETEV
jgi:predicted flap endonuclease-1-like 5' DNA nuclease